MSITFDIGDELQQIVDAVHSFAADRLRPGLREFEKAGGLPADLDAALHDLGVTTLALPEKYGGSDLLDIRAAVLCSEELAWGDLGVAVSVPGPRSAGFAILELGDDEQKERLLRPFTQPGAGGRRASLAWVEGPFGIDPGAIETTAKREGDGWVLTGKKRYVQGAAKADLTLVLARDATSTAPDPWDRLALFAVEGRPAGLVAGERNRTLGLHTVSFSPLELTGVKVPLNARLAGSGKPGALRQALSRTIARKKVLDAARLVGCVRAASEYAFKYATEREAFGVKLYEHQALAFMMADMATRVDGLRTLVWAAAWALDKGQDGYAECRRAHDHASDLAVDVTSDAVQVLGGHGYLHDHPVEKWMRDARTLGVADGLTMDEDADVLAAAAVGGK